MILNFSLLLVSLSVLFLYFYWIDRFQLTPLATNFHLFGATTYLVGTLSIFDQADQMQIEWALYCFTSFLFLIAGIFFANIIFAIKLKKSTTNLQYISWENSSDTSTNSFIVFMAILSLVATIYFFILIGTVVPIEAVLNLAQGADILESGKSATESRKNIHYGASGEYYGAGYFSQFTNTILPLSSVLFYYLYKTNGNKSYLAMFLISIPLAIIAMTGTGRRGVIAGFIFFIIMWTRWRPLSELRPSAVSRTYIMTAGIIIVGLMTTIIARDVVSDNPFINSLFGFKFIFDRVFISPAIQELEVFMIFLGNTSPVNGAGWIVMLNDILPGHRPGLAQEIHSLLGGSEYGNAGFGLYGEKYYNFGWLGATLVSFLWGIALHTFDNKIINFRRKDFSWIVMCYAAFCLGMAAAPIDLFNGGFITCLIYLFCYQIFNLLYRMLLIAQKTSPKEI